MLWDVDPIVFFNQTTQEKVFSLLIFLPPPRKHREEIATSAQLGSLQVNMQVLHPRRRSKLIWFFSISAKSYVGGWRETWEKKSTWPKHIKTDSKHEKPVCMPFNVACGGCDIALASPICLPVRVFIREVPRWADYEQNTAQNTYWKNGPNQSVKSNPRLRIEAGWYIADRIRIRIELPHAFDCRKRA